MPATAEETRRYMLVYYVALSSIFWFDWLATLREEYRKIWKSKWTAVKIIYLVNRYAMLILTVFVLQGFNMDWNTSKCTKYMLGWQNALPLIVQAAIGFMLMLRCYAIWQSSKTVLAILMVLHVADMAVSCWLSIAYVKTMAFPGESGPCIPYNSRPGIMLGCIMALIYDLAATGSTLYKALQVKKTMGKTMKSTIVSSLIRHGTFYAFGTAVIVCANMALLRLSAQHDTPFRGYLGGNLCTVFNTVLACRMVLSLKRDAEVGRVPVADSTTDYRAGYTHEHSARPTTSGGSASGWASRNSKTALVAFPKGTRSKSTIYGHGGCALTKDGGIEMDSRDTDFELNYIQEEEKGIGLDEKNTSDEKDDIEESIKRASIKRVPAVIKAMEASDLEKGA